MTVMTRSAFQPKNFLWIGLSAILLMFGGQRQAIASEGTTSGTIQPQNLLEEPQVPPLGTPSLYLPAEEIAPETIADNIRLVIKLHDRRVYVYQNDKVKTSYPIAVGKRGWETPTGSYKVLDMRSNPAWQHPWNGEVIPPGPDNPLGARWIAFWTDGRNFIGFHGTPNEKLVGQAVSHGCIRMRNKDILALYSQVKIGTPVVVEP
jgi:lipoprotein-anchoring transpeptidase ErfK/SrfK